MANILDQEKTTMEKHSAEALLNLGTSYSYTDLCEAYRKRCAALRDEAAKAGDATRDVDRLRAAQATEAFSTLALSFSPNPQVAAIDEQPQAADPTSHERPSLSTSMDSSESAPSQNLATHQIEDAMGEPSPITASNPPKVIIPYGILGLLVRLCIVWFATLCAAHFHNHNGQIIATLAFFLFCASSAVYYKIAAKTFWRDSTRPMSSGLAYGNYLFGGVLIGSIATFGKDPQRAFFCSAWVSVQLALLLSTGLGLSATLSAGA